MQTCQPQQPVVAAAAAAAADDDDDADDVQVRTALSRKRQQCMQSRSVAQQIRRSYAASITNADLTNVTASFYPHYNDYTPLQYCVLVLVTDVCIPAR